MKPERALVCQTAVISIMANDSGLHSNTSAKTKQSLSLSDARELQKANRTFLVCTINFLLFPWQCTKYTSSSVISGLYSVD
jgi:hypothetical protein